MSYEDKTQKVTEINAIRLIQFQTHMSLPNLELETLNSKLFLPQCHTKLQKWQKNGSKIVWHKICITETKIKKMFNLKIIFKTWQM